MNKYFAVMTVSSVWNRARSIPHTVELELHGFDKREVYLASKDWAMQTLQAKYSDCTIEEICVDFFDCWVI